MKAEKRITTEEDLRQAGIQGSTTPSAKRVLSHSSLEGGELEFAGAAEIFRKFKDLAVSSWEIEPYTTWKDSLCFSRSASGSLSFHALRIEQPEDDLSFDTSLLVEEHQDFLRNRSQQFGRPNLCANDPSGR
jgi:hypothetical protein